MDGCPIRTTGNYALARIQPSLRCGERLAYVLRGTNLSAYIEANGLLVQGQCTITGLTRLDRLANTLK